METIKLSAPNDRNGNPRRVFIVIDSGNVIATYDEGYQGTHAIVNLAHRKAYSGIVINVSAREYKAWNTGDVLVPGMVDRPAWLAGIVE